MDKEADLITFDFTMTTKNPFSVILFSSKEVASARIWKANIPWAFPSWFMHAGNGGTACHTLPWDITTKSAAGNDDPCVSSIFCLTSSTCNTPSSIMKKIWFRGQTSQNSHTLVSGGNSKLNTLPFTVLKVRFKPIVGQLTALDRYRTMQIILNQSTPELQPELGN